MGNIPSSHVIKWGGSRADRDLETKRVEGCLCSVKYTCLDKAMLHVCGQRALMAKADIESAFWLLQFTLWILPFFGSGESIK